MSQWSITECFIKFGLKLRKWTERRQKNLEWIGLKKLSIAKRVFFYENSMYKRKISS